MNIGCEILHLQPGVWKNPLGEDGALGLEDSGGSFLFAVMRESLGKMTEE